VSTSVPDGTNGDSLHSTGEDATVGFGQRPGRQELVQALERAGKPVHHWTGTDGSEVLVLPYGARLLGLFAPGSDENFFWTHPALRTGETALAFYRGSEWHNSGGDRTWLSPEVDFFFPHFPNVETYVQPRELDSGDYEVRTDGGSVTLSNRFSVHLSRPKSEIVVELSKCISSVQNPLRLRTSSALASLQYAGYSVRTRLAILSGADKFPVRAGIWQLVQLPLGGEFLIPTHSRGITKTFLGHIDPGDLTMSEHLVRYRTRAKGEHKLAVDAVSATGRSGYVYSQGTHHALVIRNTFVNPSGNYVDVPVTAPDDSGYTVQACSINSRLGQFAELEHHAPATGEWAGDVVREDHSQLWAFRGPEQSVLGAARLLLSSEV
jgi:hypothetical protein